MFLLLRWDDSLNSYLPSPCPTPSSTSTPPPLPIPPASFPSSKFYPLSFSLLKSYRPNHHVGSQSIIHTFALPLLHFSVFSHALSFILSYLASTTSPLPLHRRTLPCSSPLSFATHPLSPYIYHIFPPPKIQSLARHLHLEQNKFCHLFNELSQRRLDEHHVMNRGLKLLCHNASSIKANTRAVCDSSKLFV